MSKIKVKSSSKANKLKNKQIAEQKKNSVKTKMKSHQYDSDPELIAHLEKQVDREEARNKLSK